MLYTTDNHISEKGKSNWPLSQWPCTAMRETMQDARQSNLKHPDMPDHSLTYGFAWKTFSKFLMLRSAD